MLGQPYFSNSEKMALCVDFLVEIMFPCGFMVLIPTHIFHSRKYVESISLDYALSFVTRIYYLFASQYILS